MENTNVTRKNLPLIYACSGCSDVAQLANNAAVKLDHAGCFEMSCISGVGGKIKPLVKTAQSGRPITVIDGCPCNVPERVWKISVCGPDAIFACTTTDSRSITVKATMPKQLTPFVSLF